MIEYRSLLDVRVLTAQFRFACRTGDHALASKLADEILDRWQLDLIAPEKAMRYVQHSLGTSTVRDVEHVNNAGDIVTPIRLENCNIANNRMLTEPPARSHPLPFGMEGAALHSSSLGMASACLKSFIKYCYQPSLILTIIAVFFGFVIIATGAAVIYKELF